MTSRAACHCGAIVIEIPDVPDKVVECNCSICRRLGALWVYRPPEEVALLHNGGATCTYVWGERRIEFHTCRICGCTTHWENLQPQDDSVMAVNVRLVDPVQTSDLRIRRFDGADR